jgi:hypothetical protein
MDDYEFYKILVELDLQQRKLIKTERYIDELHIIIDKIKNKQNKQFDLIIAKYEEQMITNRLMILYKDRYKYELKHLKEKHITKTIYHSDNYNYNNIELSAIFAYKIELLASNDKENIEITIKEMKFYDQMLKKQK